MEKLQQVQEELVELRSKYNAEQAKYDTHSTRKACVVVGAVCFVLGFLVKAMLF